MSYTVNVLVGWKQSDASVDAPHGLRWVPVFTSTKRAEAVEQAEQRDQEPGGVRCAIVRMPSGETVWDNQKPPVIRYHIPGIGGADCSCPAALRGAK